MVCLNGKSSILEGQGVHSVKSLELVTNLQVIQMIWNMLVHVLFVNDQIYLVLSVEAAKIFVGP